MTKHYGRAVVVFDVYEAGPSTKDSTHQRRTGLREESDVQSFHEIAVEKGRLSL